jgi:hypothetical protein
MTEFFKLFENLELFKDNKGLFIAAVCIVSLVCYLKPSNDKLWNWLDGTFNQRSIRELLDRIDNDSELDSLLSELIRFSENRPRTKSDICRAKKFFYISPDGLLQVRSEERDEKYSRYLSNFLRFLFFILGMFFYCIAGLCIAGLSDLSDVPFKLQIAYWAIALILLIGSFVLSFPTASAHSRRRIKKEINQINHNKILCKKSKSNSWLNNLSLRKRK